MNDENVRPGESALGVADASLIDVELLRTEHVEPRRLLQNEMDKAKGYDRSSWIWQDDLYDRVVNSVFRPASVAAAGAACPLLLRTLVSQSSGVRIGVDHCVPPCRSYPRGAGSVPLSA